MALSISFFAPGTPSCLYAETIIVGGTGSGLGIMRILGNGFSRVRPGCQVKVLPSLGTGGGIRALRSGAIDVAVTSRALDEKERAGLKPMFLGRTALVFAVHPDTAAEDVTLPMVIDIYEGNVTTWPDGKKVRPVIRPERDSDWLLLKGMTSDMARALDRARKKKGMYIAMTDQDTAEYLENVRGSFGPMTLTMILSEKREVKVLTFGGVRPDLASVEDGKYPLKKQYFIVINENSGDAAKEFVQFLRSVAGEQMLRQAGMKNNLFSHQQ